MVIMKQHFGKKDVRHSLLISNVKLEPFSWLCLRMQHLLTQISQVNAIENSLRCNRVVSVCVGPSTRSVAGFSDSSLSANTLSMPPNSGTKRHALH